MAKIRWRLVAGLVSLGLSVILTIPASGAAGQLSSRAAEILPSGVASIADIIWPNTPVVNIIWPNETIVDGAAGTSSP